MAKSPGTKIILERETRPPGNDVNPGEGSYVSCRCRFVILVLNGPFSSWVFREPVDPVLLGIPTYFDVIPRKDARDLRTIRQKLDNDKYDTVEGFEADLDLMMQNAITFNGQESEVGDIAIRVQARVQELMNNFKSGGTKKRKDGDKGTPQPAKKLKLG